MSNTDKHIAFLLGSGFSVPAGLPTARDISNATKTMIDSSTYSSFHDGNTGILQCFVLNQALEGCDKERFNYEQFFDCLEEEKSKTLDAEKLFLFVEKGMYEYYWICNIDDDKNSIKHRKQITEIYEALKKECCNGLSDYSKIVEGVEQTYQIFIANSILGNTVNGKLDHYLAAYNGFMSILSHYVNQGYIIDVYTLNHDLYLESFLVLTDLNGNVCNGFGGETKVICGKKFKEFSLNYFNNSIRIYKLHGSIDVHELSFADRAEKHYIQIVDGYSDENAFIMESTQFASILPLFLTGKTSKEKRYKQEPFHTMLGEFKNNIGKAEKLIVIGYSGNDDGINEIIFDNYSNWNDAYVVIPNAKEHCFVKDRHARPVDKKTEFLTAKDLDVD